MIHETDSVHQLDFRMCFHLNGCYINHMKDNISECSSVSKSTSHISSFVFENKKNHQKDFDIVER